ncbi:hypothetical protein ACFOQM_06190 [Paenibacillus sp. GCM10012307]|uniref:Uncharacterized protein n=1 Tax=Paenibacillus roseus TaxID=2798579 RepID=A0A934J3M2_9BACL|nr:hypothetical protein [Paenibacillus roseus]MBJ6360888.1 hypothetical protein [Paenibacillus roseus]
MKSKTRQQAAERLTQIQARLYQIGQEEKALTDEARTIAGFLNLAQQEDKELADAAAKADASSENPGSA